MRGKKPMEKNVRVIDETGKIIGTTYPKRARDL
jgi:sugar diacid utilization regulator